ncbi:thioesterase [Haematospirillum sp. 15-248]|uniref:thioesterase family protein n=1 Tax=Haematospirillum sp. 15-248 TaxID=2723107 RepID=UPI00143C4E33|nr:acyl-CoA thioesterase [Haematospirillum sp. 15-248]NKD87244.1 thioesterase [Haematospirillum sp. 15-248]
MTLWLRFLWLLICVWFRPRLGFTETSVLKGRVWPSDVDLNMHMNNAHYAAVMDLGRIDLMVRCGMWKLILKNRLQAMVGAQMLRYRKGLRPFQPFQLETRLVCWDERWLWIEQKFVTRKGVVACIAMVKTCFVDAAGVVDPSHIATMLGADSGLRPPLPHWAESWNDVEVGALERKT